MSYFYLNVWWPAEGLPAPSIFPMADWSGRNYRWQRESKLKEDLKTFIHSNWGMYYSF